MSKPFYEEGLHVAEAVAQAIGKANTGNPQLIIRVKILGIPDGEGTHTAHRQQLERTIYMTVTEKTVGFVLENLAVAGFDGEKVSQFDPSHAEHVSIVGNQLYVWCSYEEGQNNGIREKWQISKGPSKLEVTALDSKEMRQLDSLFAKALKAAPKPVEKKATKKQADTRDDIAYGPRRDFVPGGRVDWGDDPGITDEDIPF